MQPVELSLQASSGLIEMHDRFLLGQVDLDGSVYRLDIESGFLAGLHQRAFSHSLPIEFRQGLADPFQGDHLVLIQVYRLGFDLRPILDRLSNPFGKVSPGHSTAVRAALDFGLMLGHFYLDQRQIKYLPPLNPFGINPFQQGPAVSATLRPMHFHSVRMAHRLQRTSFMPRLPTTFLAVPFSQALGSWLAQSIAGGWFTSVAAGSLPADLQKLAPFQREEGGFESFDQTMQ